MAVDPSVVGTELPSLRMTVDAGRLRFFAKAIGETAEVYTGDDPVVPPTFLYSIEFEQRDPFAWLTQIGVDLRHLLHAEQSFTYHSMARAGDTLIGKSRIADVYSRKGGALQFIVKETAVTRVDGTPMADVRIVAVVHDIVGAE